MVKLDDLPPLFQGTLFVHCAASELYSRHRRIAPAPCHVCPVALRRLQNPTLIVDRVHTRDPHLLTPSGPIRTTNPLRAAATVSPRLPSLRSSPAPPAQTFVIDRTGEMPEGARSPPPQPGVASPRPSGSSPAPYGNGSRAGTPLGVGAVTAAPLPSRFPTYDLDVDEPRPGTPEPIKVMRAKKKGSGSGSGKKEKRRTQTRQTDSSTTQT